MECILFMVSIVSLSMEYLHSMSFKHLLTLYVVSFTSYPCELFYVSDGYDIVWFAVFRSFMF
jgi:hypothetical protein